VQIHIQYKYKVSIINDEISFTYFCWYSDYFYVLVVQNAPSDRRVVSEAVRLWSQV